MNDQPLNAPPTDCYVERGAARYRAKSGQRWAVKSLARLVVTRQGITLQAIGADFVFSREKGFRIGLRDGWFSDGLEIADDEHGAVVFWTSDRPRLIDQLVAFGYENQAK